MRSFAHLLPVTVICDLIGIPQADREMFRPLAADLIAGRMDEPRQAQDARAAAGTATVRLNDYFAALAGERRQRPRVDLITELVQFHDAGDGRLLARFPDIAPAGEMRRLPGVGFRGFECLPVRVAGTSPAS